MAQGPDAGVTQDFGRITLDDDRGQAVPSDASPARPDDVDTRQEADKGGPAPQDPPREASKGDQRMAMMPSASSLADEGVLPSPVSTSLGTPFTMADASYWIPGPDGMPMPFNPYGQPMFFPAPGSPFPLSPVSDDGAAAAASAAAAAVAAAGVGGYVGAYSPYGGMIAPVGGVPSDGGMLPFMFAPPSPGGAMDGAPGGGGGGPLMYGMAPPPGGGYDPVAAAMMAPYMMDPQAQAQAQAYFQAAAMGSFGLEPPTRSGRQQYSHSAPPSPGRNGRRGRSSASPSGRAGMHGGGPHYSPAPSQQLPPSGAARQGTPAMAVPIPVPLPGQLSPPEAYTAGVGHSSAPSSPGKDSSGAPERLRRRSSSTTDVLSETPRGPRAGLGAMVGPPSADGPLEGGPGEGGAAYASARKAADMAVISVVRDVCPGEAGEEEALAREARGVREALQRGQSAPGLAPLSALPRQSIRFFVVKSYSEDDVHKALKYRCWSSTVGGNRKLDAAYRACCAQSPPGRLLIFFSVNASGQFCGVAEMVSPVDFGAQAPFWQQATKWSGKFVLRWHCVKDVPNAALRHILLVHTGAASPTLGTLQGPDAQPQPPKPVTNSRDAQEVPYDAGVDVLRVFMTPREGGTTLLDDMLFYSQREAERDRQRRGGTLPLSGRRAHPVVQVKPPKAGESEPGPSAGQKEQ